MLVDGEFHIFVLTSILDHFSQLEGVSLWIFSILALFLLNYYIYIKSMWSIQTRSYKVPSNLNRHLGPPQSSDCDNNIIHPQDIISKHYIMKDVRPQ